MKTMFFLKDLVAGNNISLLEPKEYAVGRKCCEILLENDQSISRKHAIIRVKDDHVTLEDCKSKYHTLLNGDQVDPNVEIKLNHMDTIQFGVFNSKFCFEAYQFVASASALSVDRKADLKKNLTKCNGKYVEKWSKSCTHLTVEKITLTIKVLQALIDEKPLVMPEYWADHARSIENKTPPPDINNYNKPPVAEQLLRSDFQYKLDPRRKTLFNNKMFVFLNRTIKKQMEEVINSCGGQSMSWIDDGPITFNGIIKSQKEHIFIRADNDEENVSFNAIIKDFAKEKKRAIPLNEIALAILHCSCDINCNPNFNKVSEVFGSRTQKHQTMRILAGETQTHEFLTPGNEIKTEKVIPPTIEDDWAMDFPQNKGKHDEPVISAGIKRPSDVINEENAFKKPKQEKEEEQKHKEKEKQINTTSASSTRNKKTAPSSVEDSLSINNAKQTQKRKAEEDLEKSNSKKINPFTFMKINTTQKNKIEEEENPFELTRASSKSKSTKRPSTDHENPFASIRSVSKSNLDVTVKEETHMPRNEIRKEIRLIPNKSNTTFDTSMKKSFLNSTWMSKSSVLVKSVEKEEDPEFLQIIEAFQNCVKVEILPVFNRTASSKGSLNNISVDSVDGKKNFKKFRKVKPAKPQVTIIPRSKFTKIPPGETTGIEVNNLSDSDDEIDSLSSNKKQKPVQRVKKFVL